MDGFGVSKGWSAEEEAEIRLPHDAPTVHIRGIAYNGTIEIRAVQARGPGDRAGRRRPRRHFRLLVTELNAPVRAPQAAVADDQGPWPAIRSPSQRRRR